MPSTLNEFLENALVNETTGSSFMDKNIKVTNHLLGKILDKLAEAGMLTAKLVTKAGGVDSFDKKAIHDAILDAIEVLKKVDREYRNK